MDDPSNRAPSGPLGPLFRDRETYFQRYQERRSAFTAKLAEQQARKAVFEADRARAMAEFEDALSDEIGETRQSLAEVAPISSGEADRTPVLRAAYTDRMAALMAKLSLLAYIEFEDPAKRPILDTALQEGGLKLVGAFAEQDTEAFVTEATNFIAVSFRGTTSKRDTKTDWRFSFSATRVPGHRREVQVHSGFYEAFLHIAPGMHELLEKLPKEKPIYLTGHSLGGALALVAAAGWSGGDVLGPRIAAVYTFGAPRVGKLGYYAVVKAPHHRVVNEHDLVPQVPPSWLSGYRHSSDALTLKNNKMRPSRSRPWGSAFLLMFVSLFLWPFGRRLLFLRFHDISLYCARLDVIAATRGEWS